MRAKTLITALSLLVCSATCARRIEKHEQRQPLRFPPVSRAPLRFAREQHLFIEPSAVLVPRALLPTRGGGLWLVPERRWIYRYTEVPSELVAIDADSYQLLATLEFERRALLYVDRVDGSVYQLTGEGTVRALGAGSKLAPSTTYPIRWISDPEGNPLYSRVQLEGSESRLLIPFNLVTLIEEDERRGLIYVGDSDSVLAFDTRTDTLVASRRLAPASIRLDAGGGRLYVAEGQHADRISVLEAGTLRVLRTLKSPSPYAMCIDPERALLFVSSFDDTRLRVFDAKDGRLLASQECTETPNPRFVDPRTSIVYVQVLEAVVACETKK